MSNITKDSEMEPEYDFSKGERRKFYSPDTVLHIPVYLDPDVEEYIRALAQRTGQLVNEWLRNSIGIIRSIEPVEQA